MHSWLLFGTTLCFTIIIVSSLDPGPDFSLAFSATDAVPQGTGLLLDQADELSSITQPTSLFDQTEPPSEGSDLFTSDVPTLTSLALSPDELSHDPIDSFLNQSPPLLDISTLFGGSEPHLDEASGSLFESDVDSSKSDEFNIGSLSDHTLLFDNSFDLADCAMSSDSLSGMIGGQKSRLKRLDDNPNSCKNPPTATPPKGGAETLPGGENNNDEIIEFPDLLTIFNNPYFRRKFVAARRNRDHNSFCYLFSEGILPWGVCSSGDPDDVYKTSEQLHVITVGFFDAYELTHCTLGTYVFFAFTT